MSLQLVLASAATVEVTSAAEEAGSGRTGSVAALLMGVLSIALGGLALNRARRDASRSGPNASLASLFLGLLGLALSLLLLTDSAGAVGSGNGRGGAIVGLAVGVLGAAVGAVATVRSRRVARSAS